MPENRPLEPELLPSVAAVPWHSLDPRYPTLVLFSRFISWLLLGAVGAPLMALGLIPLTWPGFILIWGVLLVPTFLVYAAARVKRYAIREQDVLFREGLLWHSMTALPRSRIQHIETQSGPLERAFGLITLKCYGAGGVQADLVIPGLATALGQRLRQHLLNHPDEPPVAEDGDDS